MKKKCLFLLSVLLLVLSLSSPLFSEILKIHYNRFENDYRNWNLWVWTKGQEGRSMNPAGQDKFGLYFHIDPETFGRPGEIGFILRKGNWESREGNSDRYIKNKTGEIWLLQNDENLYTSEPSLSPKVLGAFIDSKNKISILLSKKTDYKELNGKNVSVLNGKKESLKIKSFFAGYIIKPVNSFEIVLEKEMSLTDDLSSYTVVIKGMEGQKLTLRNILSDPSFYTDRKMGYTYTEDRTIFRVFSPLARKITLQIYAKPNDRNPEVIDLVKKEKGYWEAAVEEDLLHKYYTYKVYGENPGFHPETEIIDIYSQCNTGSYGKGLIVDDKTPVAASPSFPVEDSVIYEVHVRDFTVDPASGIKNKGKYLGLTETGTRFKGLRTGLDHLTELGINVVQIMPVQDFDNNEEDNTAYNWGYMPVNFFSPDGWYSTCVQDDSRVREFKMLVDSLHKKGIKVVMDVVYNHASPNSAFEKMCPDYYFRKKPDGTFWNGSGCGNEFQSEYPMAQKFILDSVKYWVEEYKIDGYRFDLMGLIDVDTMYRISEELHKIKKDILIYGEPWAGGDTPVKQTVKGTQKGKGFGCFNDRFRDAIKGSVFNAEYGYVQGQLDTETIENVKNGITGSINDFTESPLETINYAECHDNHTLWDRLSLSLKQCNDPNKENAGFIKQMQKMAGAILFFSQGLPFIQAGQEMCRTKKGIENSYNKEDSINQVSWDLKEKNLDVFEYHKGLIRLRKEHPAFKLRTKQEVQNKLEFVGAPYGCIYYLIKDQKDAWKRIVVLINPYRMNKTFTLLKGEWNLVVNEKKAGVEILQPGLKNSIILPPASVYVLYQ
ncbi:MAG: type I pullulanase [bacterium]|nr:type I pullulanase [bacterium]